QAEINDAGNYYCLISNQKYSAFTDTVEVKLITEMKFHTDMVKPFELLCPGDSIVLSASKSFGFDCEPITYQWFKNNDILTGEANSSLVISALGNENIGTYFCRASFQELSCLTDTISLYYQMAYHTELYQPYSLKCHGDSIVLKARKSGIFICDPIAYQWFHNSEAITVQIDSILIINSFEVQDVGEYYCKAFFDDIQVSTNPIQLSFETSYPFHLELIKAFDLNCPGDSLVLKARKSLGFSCEPISYQWFRNEEPLLDEQDSVLIISSFDIPFAGNYFCKASFSDFQSFTDTINLSVQMAYQMNIFQPFALRCPGDSVVLKAQKTVSFSCVPNLYQWFKNDEPLAGQTDSIIVFSSFVNTDIGDYYCKSCIGEYCVFTDTVHVTFLTAGFVEDSLFDPVRNIPADLNADGVFDVFRSLSFYSEGPNTATEYYSPYNSTNLVDIDNDGLPEHLARRDSLRFYKLSGSDWAETGFVLPQTNIVKSRDIDNDGDNDFLMNNGKNCNGSINVLLMNGLDYAQINIGNFICEGGTLDLIDIDNDQDVDVLITGLYMASGPVPISQIWFNHNGQFIQSSNSIQGFCNSSTDWGDYDNDGDLDLLVSGSLSDWPKNYHTKIYKNENG
ncbi:MAG: FG-GAP-like repeat-containing protein, partial [Bacteroidales bacterium]